MQKSLIASIYNSKCSLGEGLFVLNDKIYWVDINKNRIFFLNQDDICFFKTYNKPSVIFSVNDNEILFGSDRGITKYNILSKKEKVCNESPKDIYKNFRSNDGTNYNNLFLLGFMHRSNPDLNAGYIYAIDNNGWVMIDNEIKIPNSFIKISNSQILISDSFEKKIWLFEFDESKNFKSKTLWAEINNNYSPDGGCFFDDKIYISMWDGYGIGVFNKIGNMINFIDLPVKRPTNCKFEEKSSILWITSASEGIIKKPHKINDLNGCLLKYKLTK